MNSFVRCLLRGCQSTELNLWPPHGFQGVPARRNRPACQVHCCKTPRSIGAGSSCATISPSCVVGADDSLQVGVGQLMVDPVDEGTEFAGVDEESLTPELPTPLWPPDVHRFNNAVAPH